ncbi:MAG: PKD domain-containing protein, partial [Flavobacteriales bacterium]
FMAFIDSTADLLYQGPAERNFAIWQSLNGVPYSQQVLNLKVFMYQRLTWIDQTLAPFGAELPTVQIPQDTTVCVGITYTAPYNPLYSYNWIPGPETPDILLESAGSYVLAVEDAFGCYNSFPFQVSLSIPDSTIVEIMHVSGDVTYAFAGANGPTSQYVWDFGDQTQTSTGMMTSHIYASPGIYSLTLTVTDSLGCSAQNSKQLQITEGAMNVEIYPNPVGEQLTIHHNLPADKSYRFDLFDLSGRIIKSIENQLSPFSLEVTTLAKGSYWLRCTFGEETIGNQIVKW